MVNKKDIYVADEFIQDFHSRQQIIQDAGESAFFLRELEYVKARTYDTLYKDLKAFTLFPISNEADEGAQNIVYQQYTKVGVAKIIADYADDAPRTDVYGTEVTKRVYRVGDSYGYDVAEIRRSKMAGKGLEMRKAESARRASDEKINSIAFSGDTDHSIEGFIDYTGITEYTLSTGSAGDTFALKTPDEIITDLSGIVTAIISATNAKEQPDTLLLPIDQYMLIANTRMTGNTDKSILQYFLDTNPFITTVDWLSELSGAGASGGDRMMAYKRDPMKLELEIPLPYRQLAPQAKGYGFEVLTETTTAGVIVYYPLSIAYCDGI